jgi:hypothetical protein
MECNLTVFFTIFKGDSCPCVLFNPDTNGNGKEEEDNFQPEHQHLPNKHQH